MDFWEGIRLNPQNKPLLGIFKKIGSAEKMVITKRELETFLMPRRLDPLFIEYFFYRVSHSLNYLSFTQFQSYLQSVLHKGEEFPSSTLSSEELL